MDAIVPSRKCVYKSEYSVWFYSKVIYILSRYYDLESESLTEKLEIDRKKGLKYIKYEPDSNVLFYSEI